MMVRFGETRMISKLPGSEFWLNYLVWAVSAVDSKVAINKPYWK